MNEGFQYLLIYFQAILLQLPTAVGALLGTYISLLAEGMGENLNNFFQVL